MEKNSKGVDFRKKIMEIVRNQNENDGKKILQGIFPDQFETLPRPNIYLVRAHVIESFNIFGDMKKKSLQSANLTGET